MKRFCVRMLLFIALPIPLLYGLNYVIDNGLQKSNYIYYAEWNDLFNGKINADLLICGSSRAWKDVSPAILDSALHLNTYNLGMDGTHFSIQYDRVKMYLLYNKAPKYIVHTFDFTSFAERNSMDNQLQFLPYLSNNEVINYTDKYADHFTWAERYVPLFKYNNQLGIFKEGVNSFFGRGVPAIKYKGYQGQQQQWDHSFDRYITRNPNPVSIHVAGYSVKRLYDYLEFCNKKGIKVILVFPPVYYEFLHYCKNKDYIFSIFRNCQTRYGVNFLDYSNDELSQSKNNFYNSQHLNKAGAEMFSVKLAKDIKPLLR